MSQVDVVCFRNRHISYGVKPNFWANSMLYLIHWQNETGPAIGQLLRDVTRRRTSESMEERHPAVLSCAESCAVCLDTIQKKKTLTCLHSFCSECIESVFKLKPACPICNRFQGVYTGTQPSGSMTVTRSRHSLPGFDGCGSIIINYQFPSGVQGVRHTADTLHSTGQTEVNVYVWRWNQTLPFTPWISEAASPPEGDVDRLFPS